MFDSTTGKLITGLTNGSVGQVLTINNNGTPSWITPVSQTWRAINYQNSGQPAAQILSNSTDSGDLTFGAAGNMRLSWDNATNTLTFTLISDNSWRDVLAYTTSSLLPQSIGENADLIFSSDFLWIEGELVTGWATVDSSGNITYSR